MGGCPAGKIAQIRMRADRSDDSPIQSPSKPTDIIVVPDAWTIPATSPAFFCCLVFGQFFRCKNMRFALSAFANCEAYRFSIADESSALLTLDQLDAKRIGSCNNATERELEAVD